MRKYDEVQELIKRLRNNKVTLGHGEYGVDPLCELAAKELEAITARLVSYDCQTAMNDNIVGKLCEYAKDDHERGCQGRNYDCTCGYDDKRDQLIDEAVGKIDNQQAEIGRLKEKCDRQAMVIRRMYVEHYPNQWFAWHGYGEKDQNGLPQYIEVVPAHGVGWTQVYERTERTISMEGS